MKLLKKYKIILCIAFERYINEDLAIFDRLDENLSLYEVNNCIYFFERHGNTIIFEYSAIESRTYFKTTFIFENTEEGVHFAGNVKPEMWFEDTYLSLKPFIGYIENNLVHSFEDISEQFPYTQRDVDEGRCASEDDSDDESDEEYDNYEVERQFTSLLSFEFPEPRRSLAQFLVSLKNR